jgi:hypothetical protein
MWERRDAYRILMGKPERKRPLERPRCRKNDNIRMDLQEMGWWMVRTELIWPNTGAGGRHL